MTLVFKASGYRRSIWKIVHSTFPRFTFDVRTFDFIALES